jgi:NAD(P)-dependent dehydrogenase (short-subunit alcohol dehydrogenase family)
MKTAIVTGASQGIHIAIRQMVTQSHGHRST